MILDDFGLFDLPRPAELRRSCCVSEEGVLGETSMASSKVSEGEVSVETLFVLEAAATALDIAATAVTAGAAFCCFADARDGARSSLIWTELVLEALGTAPELVLEALGAAQVVALEALGIALEEGVAAEVTGATVCC